jgi:hypothetical protein
VTGRANLPPTSRERPMFTWLVRIGVLANLAVVLFIAYYYLVS